MEYHCLTQLSQTNGCQIDTPTLKKILEQIQKRSASKPQNLLVGHEIGTDCAIYDDLDHSYLLFTTDFSTPLVDDPYEFGWIAAANALSAIFSMGGRPLLANAVLGYPPDRMSLASVEQIVRGGSDAISEVGCVQSGGHTIHNPQPFYGFSIIGRVTKQNLKTYLGAQPSDVLLLTKPLGAGIVINAIKLGILDQELYREILPFLKEINQVGESIAQEIGVHAVTSVSDLGLLGHCLDMVNPKTELELFDSQIPFYPHTEELAKSSFSSKMGGIRNWNSYTAQIQAPSSLSMIRKAMLGDPQSNGGLLIAVSPEKKDHILDKIKQTLKREVSVIGQFVSQTEKGRKIHIQTEARS